MKPPKRDTRSCKQNGIKEERAVRRTTALQLLATFTASSSSQDVKTTRTRRWLYANTHVLLGSNDAPLKAKSIVIGRLTQNRVHQP